MNDISFKGCSHCVNITAPIHLKDGGSVCVQCMSDHEHPHKFYKEKKEKKEHLDSYTNIAVDIIQRRDFNEAPNSHY